MNHYRRFIRHSSAIANPKKSEGKSISIEEVRGYQYWAMTGFAERFDTVNCLQSSLLALKTLPKPGDCPSLRGVVYSEPPRCIFPDHVTGKPAPTFLTLWGLQKGSGDCKNDGADRRTQFAPSCAIIFVSPQRVSGRDDIVRWQEPNHQYVNYSVV